MLDLALYAISEAKYKWVLKGITLNKRTYVSTDRQTDRQTDERTDGRTDGRTDNRMKVRTFIIILLRSNQGSNNKQMT